MAEKIKTLIVILIIFISLLLVTVVVVRESTQHIVNTEYSENTEEQFGIRTESLKLPKNVSFAEGLRKMQEEIKTGNATLKTPMSVLHELLMTQGKTADYNITKDHNSQEITCTITLDGVSIAAKGPNQKHAKHAASKKLIDHLAGTKVPDDFYQETRSSSISGSTARSALAMELANGNFVGVLQMFAQKKNKTLPVYDVQEESGNGKTKNFTYVVNFDGLSAYGSAPSKKVAKQIAAGSMWQFFSGMAF